MTDDELDLALQTSADNIKTILRNAETDPITKAFINELIEESIITDYIMTESYTYPTKER